jgi:NAD(P)H-hydrate epimerase
VIDADAITAVAQNPDCLKGKFGVITPHSREFRTLTDIEVDENLEERGRQAATYAEKVGLTILLKGTVDIVTDGRWTKFNRTGNAAMTVGGTGDVLAGVVGAMLAKDVSPFNSARIAAFTNGTAGDLAFDDMGYGLMPTDIIGRIPFVLNSFAR